MDINRGLYPAPNGGLQSANPAAGIPNGSEVTSALLDDMYFELLNSLSAAGVVPATATPTQVLQSLKRIFGGNTTFVTAATTISEDQLGFIELTGDTGYTTALPSPQIAGLQPLIIIFNNSAASQTLSTPAGDFEGPGGTNASTMTLAAGSVTFMRSDTANYIVQQQFAALNGSTSEAFSVAAATTAYDAPQFNQVPGGYGVAINAVTGSRALNVTYTNSSTRGMFVFVSGLSDGAGPAQHHRANEHWCCNERVRLRTVWFDLRSHGAELQWLGGDRLMQYFQDASTKKLYAFGTDVTAVQTEGVWSFKTAHGTTLAVPKTLQPAAAPVSPALTLRQQATALLAAGFTIESLSTPALNGTYACNANAQLRLNNMAAQIARAGGTAFPLGLEVLPWPDINGAVHEFPSVALWLDFEQALMNFVTAADIVVMTNAGTLPAASATIP